MSVRVAIVGGGVIGSAIAWRLARRGAMVRVIDAGTAAGAASAAAGGMLAPLAEAQRAGPFLELGLESLRRYPAFIAELEAETGLATGYVRAGKLVVALTAAEEDDLAATHGWQSATGPGQSEWLTPTRARALEPELSDQVRAAVLIRDDHRLDNVALLAALVRAARLAGAELVARGTARLLTEGDLVVGVETTGGERIEADTVVLAAGAWSGAIDGLPRPLPIRPVRGQMLALRPDRPLFGRTIAGAHGYLVPRPDGRIVIGSTMEESGFEVATTPQALAALRAAAIRLVPGLADAARAGAWAGLRPATPDGLPVLGRDPATRGLVYATGHFRNGILLTPVTADAIAADVLGESDVDLSDWSVERFDEPAAGTRERARTAIAAPPATGPGGSAAVTGAVPPDRLCDLCGAAMYEVHCKVICPACGYRRDCTDLW